MQLKNLVRHIVELLTTPRFNRFTHNTFGLLLLLTNILVPTGIHRRWMGWGGWWMYPMVAAIAMIGLWKTIIGGGTGWRYIAVPYALLFVLDAWAISIPEKQVENIHG